MSEQPGPTAGQLNLDESTAFGARAAQHLRADPVVWLTTVTDRDHT
jgi:hypothetical protein